MKLTLGAITTLKHALINTGEKEVDEKGRERWTARALKNNDEICQRRFFLKNSEEAIQQFSQDRDVLEVERKQKIKEKEEEYKKENPKKKTETEEEHKERIMNLVIQDKEFVEFAKENSKKMANLENVESEIVIEGKTKEVCKKYLDEYTEKVGWTSGNDEAVAELAEKLK